MHPRGRARLGAFLDAHAARKPGECTGDFHGMQRKYTNRFFVPLS